MQEDLFVPLAEAKTAPPLPGSFHRRRRVAALEKRCGVSSFRELLSRRLAARGFAARGNPRGETPSGSVFSAAPEVAIAYRPWAAAPGNLFLEFRLCVDELLTPPRDHAELLRETVVP
jgi:hypothetical protein